MIHFESQIFTLFGKLSFILCKCTQVFITVTIGFEPQGLSLQMWISEGLKCGHNNLYFGLPKVLKLPLELGIQNLI